MSDPRLSKITVLLADDQELVRSGLARVIDDETDMRIVAEADSGEEAIRLARIYHPDVIVMDARMPGIGGIEATQRLMQIHTSLHIVGISAVTSGAIPTQMLRAGAKAFITKGSGVDEFLEAIRVVSTGERYVTNEVATQLALNPFKQDTDSVFDRLSRRELQIALQLTDGKKVTEISEMLALSPKTVYSYRYRIFEKLGIRSDVELTILAVKQGLSDRDDDVAALPEFDRVVGAEVK